MNGMTIRKLEDGDYLVHFDCDLRAAHERRIFVASDENGTPLSPERVPILVRIGRGRRIAKLYASGQCKTNVSIAKELGLSEFMITRFVRLTFLSPIVVKKLVSGEIPAASVMALGDKLHQMPLWRDQHKALGIE